MLTPTFTRFREKDQEVYETLLTTVTLYTLITTLAIIFRPDTLAYAIGMVIALAVAGPRMLSDWIKDSDGNHNSTTAKAAQVAFGGLGYIYFAVCTLFYLVNDFVDAPMDSLFTFGLATTWLVTAITQRTWPIAVGFVLFVATRMVF